VTVVAAQYRRAVDNSAKPMRTIHGFGVYVRGWFTNALGRIADDPVLAATGMMECVQASFLIRGVAPRAARASRCNWTHY
jgi:hypothetical protein